MIEEGSEPNGRQREKERGERGGGEEKERRREKEYIMAIGRGEYEKTKSHH